jgi:GH35 family endo-1,4-beta-xylanase
MQKSICVVLLCVVAATQAQMAAGAKKFLGNITSTTVQSNFGEYWNQVTAENGCKWGSVEGTRDVMYWTDCDVAYNYAKQNNIPFKFHTLVWGSQYPAWMDNLSTVDQLTEITEWMDAVKVRYPDAQMIDVVNEAVAGHAPAPYKAALGGDGTTGYDWIITAFKMARERWPQAVLIYNDYNAIRVNTSKYIALMNAIKGSGYVDAMGFQAHGLESLDSATLRSSIKAIHDSIGLPIFITEYDINASSDAKQKKVISEHFPVFWETDYIAGVTFWGYVTGQTWKDYTGLISSSGTERPALTWLKSYLADHLNVKSPIDWSRNITGPEFTTPSSISMDENIALVTTLAAMVSSGGTIVFAINGGNDASLFTLNTTTHELNFTTAPDYDNPTDNGKDNIYNVTVSATSDGNTTTMDMSITILPSQEPYGGTAFLIPGRIEAEAYDLGGEGKAYHEANTNGNQGGATLRNDEVDIETTSDESGTYNIGYTLTGEWLAYTVSVTTAGTYKLKVRLATSGDGKIMHVEIDGTDVTGSIAVPNTGDWQAWETVTIDNISLVAGEHIMKVVFDSDYINLNWLEFVSAVVNLNSFTILSESVLVNAISDTDFQVHLNDNFTYQIVNLGGRIVESGKGHYHSSVGAALAPGLYFLNVKASQNHNLVQKIVKQ